MKKLIGALLALCASVAFGATTLPVQLINPTGSTSGQAIVSTGASSAPAWGGVPVGGLAAIAANTVIGNATGSSAIPTAITVTGCNGAAQALQWTNGTGFGCNSSIATSGANSNITGLSGLTSPVALPGVTNGSNATAGNVGEYVTATGTAVALTSAVATNCTSISLTAGDWDVWGNVSFVAAATTIFQAGEAGINTTSATQPAAPFFSFIDGPTFAAASTVTFIAPTVRENLSSTTTVYLVATSNFTTSTESATCYIAARRRR